MSKISLKFCSIWYYPSSLGVLTELGSLLLPCVASQLCPCLQEADSVSESSLSVKSWFPACPKREEEGTRASGRFVLSSPSLLCSQPFTCVLNSQLINLVELLSFFPLCNFSSTSSRLAHDVEMPSVKNTSTAEYCQLPLGRASIPWIYRFLVLFILFYCYQGSLLLL